MVNPMIVEGQAMRRRDAGDRHRALSRNAPTTRTASRWPRRSSTICCPGRPDAPNFRVYHTETPSPYTDHGIKGVGEGGAIAPPAAIVNAINDALRPLGAELRDIAGKPRPGAGRARRRRT